MVVTDRLDGANELLIRDGYYLYRLSRARGSYYFSSENVRTGTRDLSGNCTPRTLLQASFLRCVSTTARGYHLVHAGAVARGGRGVLFPAMSMLGKTTLVVKLVTRGFGFLSDEVACFHRGTFLLEPFPRKVNIRKNSGELLGIPLKRLAEIGSLAEEGEEITVDIEDLVAGSLSGPCPPRYVIFPMGFGETPRLDPLSRTTALIHLLRSSISPIEDPAALMRDFAPLMGNVACFNLVMGGLDETADLVSRMVEDGPGRVA
jgi:hypothetical protein